MRRDYLFDVICSRRRRFHLSRGPQSAGNPEGIEPSLQQQYRERAYVILLYLEYNVRS